MSEELGSQEDISALWGPQGNALLRPAPLRTEPARARDADLGPAVADLAQRLDRLERQVAALTASRRASLARISKALKGH